jgi:uncharacterized membrane protein YhaH (DUF805 family)
MSSILFLIAILFFAALPVIAAFVFLEIQAAKQPDGGSINDRYRKLAKIMGWILLLGIILLFTYIAYDSWQEGDRLRKFWPALLAITVVLLKLFTTTKR